MIVIVYFVSLLFGCYCEESTSSSKQIDQIALESQQNSTNEFENVTLPILTEYSNSSNVKPIEILPTIKPHLNNFKSRPKYKRPLSKKNPPITKETPIRKLSVPVNASTSVRTSLSHLVSQSKAITKPSKIHNIKALYSLARLDPPKTKKEPEENISTVSDYSNVAHAANYNAPPVLNPANSTYITNPGPLSFNTRTFNSPSNVANIPNPLGNAGKSPKNSSPNTTLNSFIVPGLQTNAGSSSFAPNGGRHRFQLGNTYQRTPPALNSFQTQLPPQGGFPGLTSQNPYLSLLSSLGLGSPTSNSGFNQGNLQTGFPLFDLSTLLSGGPGTSPSLGSLGNPTSIGTIGSPTAQTSNPYLPGIGSFRGFGLGVPQLPPSLRPTQGSTSIFGNSALPNSQPLQNPSEPISSFQTPEINEPIVTNSAPTSPKK